MQTFVRIAIFLACLIACPILFVKCGSESSKPRVLIFNKAEFYVHDCMPAAVAALQQVCSEHGWEADVTDDAELFTEKKLRQYAAVVFLNTAGDVLNPTQQIEFERYIQAGGGFVGIHTAIDTEHNWKWYGRLVGGRFDGFADVQDATIRVLNRDNPATQQLDSSWQRRDEWFNLKDLSPDINVLLTLDESTFTGGKMGNFHPVAWYHDYDGGRAFFTAMGHTAASYSEPAFLQHLAGGLQYAIGNATTPLQFKERRAPAPANTTGFVKTSLLCDLYEPIEMELLPDGKILFIERRGTIKLFDPATNQAQVIDEFKVYIQNEEGLLGLALDPNWSQNHWIYLYYSPKESEKNAIKLSRFVFDGANLDKQSEIVLLEIPTDRSVHNYHAGGCIEFDAAGNLYLSTGDNTDHYDDGYTSIDERPGKSQFDSQKSASNSMDLRGKILRIKPMPDGSYSCPADNLFTASEVHVMPGAQLLLDDPLWQEILDPAGSGPNVSISAGFAAHGGKALAGKGRPEIFIMGCRNPFRITFDNRRHLLIWGEPGPDAGVADDGRGPEGYDEINIARTAGNYGWPYCIGNNKPYRDYNFETKKSGAWFDPQHLTNDSPNNTGMYDLPPARPPVIYYPFKSSTEFPLVANGTRCAMGGPVYYCDQYPAETRFPDQYDGKIIIYDWMRNWILAFGLDSLDHLTDMQPLAESVTLARPIDMLIDKSGVLWVLEYGTEWYSSNPDACLSRIDYIRSNGQPQAQTSSNNTPAVAWDFGGKNRSFYQPGDQVQYKVVVSDPEDGSLADGRIPPDSVHLSIEYFENRPNAIKTALQFNPATTHNPTSPLARGKNLVDASDCKACHALDRQVNGPAYQAIAERYAKDKNAVPNLVKKVIKGGSGNWGDRVMSAHPQVSEKDMADMMRWVLSLADPANRPLPVQGVYTLTAPAGKDNKPVADGVFRFRATYTDRGAGGQPSARGSQTLLLRPALQQAEMADSTSAGLRTIRRPLNGGTAVLYELKPGSFFVFKQADLKGIASVSMAIDVADQSKYTGGGRIELRLDSPGGQLAGAAVVPAANGGAGLTEVILQVDRNAWPADGSLHDLYFVVAHDPEPAKAVAGIDWLRFGF